MKMSLLFQLLVPWRMLVILATFTMGGTLSPPVSGNPPAGFDTLADEYSRTVRPLVERFCFDCHDSRTREGELDLQQFVQLDAVREHPEAWQRIVHQLESGEMPPKSEEQLSAQQREAFVEWVKRYLRAEAFARAGDPGPVVLRRLSNSEYTYTIRDLTGLPTLDPVREFPIDGAAGEGFINAGAALVMSPALLEKYLDAAKEVTGHAVLLPTGIAFSEKTTPRDWTEEKLSAIRDFYAAFSVPGGETSLNLQGVVFDSKDAGVIPLERYLEATIAERAALTRGAKTVAVVAEERRLNEKYLDVLWETLNDTEPSLLLDLLRKPWRSADVGDVPALAATIRQWQHSLWNLATVGHIGKRDGPKKWQQPVTPFATSQPIQLKLPETTDNRDVTVYLIADDAGDGHVNDAVVWQQPRVVLPNQKTLRLQDIDAIKQRIEKLTHDELTRTADYLRAVAAAHASQRPTDAVAAERGLDARVLAKWASISQLGQAAVPEISGHYKTKLTDIGGYSSIRGWGSAQTPSLITNSAGQEIRYSTLTVPGRGVAMHPSPDKSAIIYWKSPVDGEIRIDGLVADADANCGNGVAWQVNMVSRTGAHTVAAGTIDNGAEQSFASAGAVRVEKNDVLKFVVAARDRHHACDTTHVAITIRETGEGERVWDLAGDVVDRIHENNPLADAYGNAAVWHFGSSPETDAPQSLLVSGSALDAWRESIVQGKPTSDSARAALDVQETLTGSADGSLAPEDRELRAQLLDWQGPFDWLGIALESLTSSSSTSVDLQTTAPSVLEFRIPAALAAGAELVTIGSLHPEKGREGSVQLRASLSEPADALQRSPQAGTIVVMENSDARKRLTRDLEDFRQLFPAALCYTKIVPVDEVVTLRLFYREDDQLRRLMLNDEQAARLNQLWNELRFISREPLKLVDVYEQLWQFATQDADPSAFEPLREPIQEAAERFGKELIAAEPRHVEAVTEFAERAWRRPLSVAEESELQDLYRQLREEELEHDAAIRMTLARVLVAPAFLYKLERPHPGTTASPVGDPELATRLSYFLWSSLPDDELFERASTGNLSDDGVLRGQTQRMLKDARVRRLAIEFGCQWLGVRNFHQLDEKSERHFPEFAGLRDSMYEETIRFFTDFFQHDRSVLSLLDADHTFVDRQLAAFYGIPAADNGGWRRVDGIDRHGRGGILAMATTLAKQSGASHTSPILRGNWVYESLLGERLPRPPKDVPQLPDTVPAGLTERQLIERHSADASCATCHRKIDPYGFALEGFDAIGRARAEANTLTTLPEGRQIDGLEGLRAYLLQDRREDFVRQFCRKLLGYALGRAVQLSDEPLLDAMVAQLAAKEYRVSVAMEQIVLSRQFRMIRGKDAKDWGGD